MTTKQAAKELGLSSELTIQNWLKGGHFPGLASGEGIGPLILPKSRASRRIWMPRRSGTGQETSGFQMWTAGNRRFCNSHLLKCGPPFGVIAFWDGSSRGTADMMGVAMDAGIPVRVVPTGSPPRRFGP